MQEESSGRMYLPAEHATHPLAFLKTRGCFDGSNIVVPGKKGKGPDPHAVTPTQRGEGAKKWTKLHAALSAQSSLQLASVSAAALSNSNKAPSAVQSHQPFVSPAAE